MNGNDALEANKEECLSAIEDIRKSPAQKACEAHGAIARGMITLLRVKVAEIERMQIIQCSWRRVFFTIITGTGKWAAVTVIAAILAGWLSKR